MFLTPSFLKEKRRGRDGNTGTTQEGIITKPFHLLYLLALARATRWKGGREKKGGRLRKLPSKRDVSPKTFVMVLTVQSDRRKRGKGNRSEYFGRRHASMGPKRAEGGKVKEGRRNSRMSPPWNPFRKQKGEGEVEEYAEEK